MIATLALAWGVHAAPPHIKREPMSNLICGLPDSSVGHCPEAVPVYFAVVVMAALRRPTGGGLQKVSYSASACHANHPMTRTTQ